MNRPANLDELYLLHIRDGQTLLGRVSGVALAEWDGPAQPAYRVTYLDGTFEYLPVAQVDLTQLGPYETLRQRASGR